MSINTRKRLYDEFIRLLFLHTHREVSTLTNEFPGGRGIGQFRFLRSSCFTNFKGAVGLMMSKTSDMRISIPLDLSSRPSIPLPRYVMVLRSMIWYVGRTSVIRSGCLSVGRFFPRPFIPLRHFFNSRRTPPLLNLSLVLFPQQPVWTEHDVCSFWNFIGLVLRYDSDTCHTDRVMSPKKKFLSGDLGSFLVCSHEFKWLNVFLFTYVSMWHFLKTDGVSNDTETFSCLIQTYESTCTHTKDIQKSR